MDVRARSSAGCGHVDELYFKSFLREDLGDAVAHRPRADHSYPLDVEHATSPERRLSRTTIMAFRL